MASDDEMWWEELERAEVPSPGSEEVEEFFRRQAVALRSPSSSSVPSSRRWRDLRWRHRMLEATESPTRLGWADSPTSEEEEEETSEEVASEEVAVEEEGSQQSEEEVAVEEEGSQQSEEVAMAVEEKKEEEVVVEEEVAMEDEPVEEIPGSIRGSRPKCRAEPQVVEEPQEEEEDDHYVPGWDDDWTAEDWRIWDMVIKAGGKNKGRKRRNEMFARFKYLMSTGQWVGTECHPLAREGRFEAKAKSRSSRPSSSSCQGG